MRKYIVVFLLAGCSTKTDQEQKKEESFVPGSNISLPDKTVQIDTVSSISEDTLEHNSEYRVTVIYSDTIGYGYEIYRQEKLFIRQPIIPAIPGNHGFKSSADAQRAGDYVKEKIEKGIVPPTMTIDELKKLGVY